MNRDELPEGGAAPNHHGGSPRSRRRRVRPTVVVRVVLFLLMVVGAYLFLPRLAGLAREAESLRHLQLLPLLAAVVLEAASLLLYTRFYQRVLAAMGQAAPFRVVFDVTMASFLVSHVSVGGSAAGVATNVDAMGRAGVNREAAGEAAGFAALFSSLSLLFVLALGLALSLGHEALPPGLLMLAGLGEFVVLGLFVLVIVLGRRPEVAERLGRWVGHNSVVRSLLSQRKAARLEASARRLSQRSRRAISRPHFLRIMAPAVTELLLDAGALYLFFWAVGYLPAPGAVLVAYGVANVLAAIPVTPAGLGVIEGSLVAVMVAYGAPAHVAVPAVLGYRIVNFWLPLPVGAAAYIRLRAAGRAGPSDPAGAHGDE